MREIKFRAWNKKTEQYVDFEELGVGVNSLAIKYIAPSGRVLYLEHGNSIVLEQYTGLKDKNGVEIYEGDIVLFDKNHENNHQEKILIDFISGKKTPCFEIVYSNNLTAFRKSLIFPPEERANHKYETTIHNGDIVVGNIHENEDLLDGH